MEGNWWTANFRVVLILYTVRGLSAEPFAKRDPDDPSDIGASLIVISLLSLGLWAAIWGIVASLAVVFG